MSVRIGSPVMTLITGEVAVANLTLRLTHPGVVVRCGTVNLNKRRLKEE